MGKNFVLWEGAASDPSGYGEATRNYVIGLDAAGMPIKLKNRSFWHGPRPDIGEKIKDVIRIAGAPFPQDTSQIIMLYNLTPENFYIVADVKCHVGMTTFETDRLPAGWLIPMRAMDEIITYTKFNKYSFMESGMNRPITVIPHGVDTDTYRPGIEPMASIRDACRGKYVFGSNFDWTNRKNPQALVRSYCKAFDGRDDVALVLKVYFQHPISKNVETIKANIAELKMESRASKPPAIILITDILSSVDMPHFYSSINCFVLPTRGEGWGLPLSEAMASGLPCIATDWGGNTEFMDKSNSYPLPSKLADISKADMARHPIYIGHKWADVKDEDLVDRMRYVFEHRDEASRIGEAARKDMCEKWTWKLACEKLKNFLESLT